MNKPTYDELIAALSESDHSNLRIKYGKIKAERDGMAKKINEANSEIAQLKQALADRTKELEMVKRVANDAVSELSELTQQLNLVDAGKLC